MSEPVLRLTGVRRTYTQGSASLEVLKGADFALPPGRMMALVGPSGAGKSTLLHICGLLEHPTSGEVSIDGKATVRLGDAERTRLRRERIGFVYQFHHLLPDFTALENVALPQLVAGRGGREARARARELLERLGLGQRTTHRPGKLSGGEQQRVAIARALANAPGLILADEPTGNLDPATAGRVFDELLAVVRATGTAALIATHNPELAARMDETWTISGGLLQRA
ncbi:MAG: ABC transporter ATP-binding protein [Geminicoccaceae bacterium]